MRLAVVVALLALATPLRADVSAPVKIRWRSDTKAAELEAGKLKRPLLVFFSAEWCMPCKEMMVRSFADPGVADLIGKRFVPLLVDMTNDDDAAHAVGQRYHVNAMPTLLAVQGGAEKLRFDHFVDAAELRAALDRIH
jgi:thiol:disulfide interchange protein